MVSWWTAKSMGEANFCGSPKNSLPYVMGAEELAKVMTWYSKKSPDAVQPDLAPADAKRPPCQRTQQQHP